MKKGLKFSLTFALTMFFGASSYAAGFQLNEFSAATMGTANAGTAVTDDASVQFYNPAAMVFFDHTTISASGIGVFPNLAFEPISSTVRGHQISGNSNSANKNAFIPGTYLIYPVNRDFALGFGIEAPFGLSTEYNDQSLARYFATESSIFTVNLNPSMAIKITPNFSFGFGLDVLYAKVTLDQALPIIPIAAPAFAAPAPTNDLFIQNKGDDWAVGWNTGLYWAATPSTSFGLAYHSRYDLSLKGTSTVTGFTSAVQQALVARFLHLTDDSISSSLILPDYGTLSAKHAINSWWNIMADVSYYDWSVIKNLTINFATPGRASRSQILDYRNTWRFAVGQEFKIAQKWKFRMGTAFDESPVRDQFRDVRLPDVDRVWVSTGVNYAFSKTLDVDVGYAHLFVKDPRVNSTNPQIGTQILANYSGSINLVGAQFNYHFNA